MRAANDCDNPDYESDCDLIERLNEMERRLATHIVGTIAVGTMILLGCMLGLTSVLLTHV